jgi:feruloyl-CoA synthase
MEVVLEQIFGAIDIERVDRSGSRDFVLRSRVPLQPFPARITDCLVEWAERDPNRVFLAERAPDDAWRTLSYGVALDRARRLGQYLLDNGCDATTSVSVVSENSIDSACFILGANYAGVVVAPISPTYTTAAGAADKLNMCVGLLKPKIVFIEDMARSGAAMRRACGSSTQFVSPMPSSDAQSFESLLNTRPTTVDKVNRQIDGDRVVKYLFTSGSTGLPKAVTTTHRMLTANQQQLAQVYPFIRRRPPILVDWLPWHHAYGGSEIFFIAASNGGTIYIDAGRPEGPLFEQTIKNLREISPTMHFNVPRGFDRLAQRMERDVQLKTSFFQNMDLLFYSGASMPQATWSKLEELATDVRGRPVPIVTAWGSTETGPFATGVHFASRRPDNIGLPAPGCEVKFAAVDERFELRVRGPNVMPGYLTVQQGANPAFDEEGYYCTGDAGSLIDIDDPSKGIMFCGRVAEDFKLLTGTWVSVGRLKALVLGALMPVASDLIIVGADKDYLAALVFLDLAEARRLIGSEHAQLAELSGHPLIKDFFGDRIAQHNKDNPGSSMRIRRIMIIPELPSSEAREMTDKGSLSRAAVLKHRAKAIEFLFDLNSSDTLIV